MLSSKPQAAFTIVELLVVVIVIAILASISLVAYRGLQDRAKVSVVKSDLTQSAKQLHFDKGSGLFFPSSLDAADNGKGLKASPGTTYQYSVDNLASTPSFCLTATSDSNVFRITDTGIPEEGACPGHTGAGGGQIAACSTFAIGDTGPGGGKIFYKDTLTTPETCYEAAPAGWYAATAPNDPKAEFGCYLVDAPGAEGIVIGTGKQNTLDIIAAGCKAATTGNLVGATIATNYRGGSKADWYLPSVDELSQIYTRKAIVGGITADVYHSSTEYSNIWNRYVNLSTGTRAISNKDPLRYIRPIRSFSN